MSRFTLYMLLAFTAAPFAFAQMPPPPKDDLPAPSQNENKKNRDSKTKKIIEPERHGVKPALPVTPPTPEPTAPDEP